jgi:dTDP-4-amino-4,6-dideoxygalactose transaminase
MKFPQLDLKAQYKSIQKEIEAKITEVLQSQMLILGPEVAALEQELAEYVGAKSGVGVSSGSDALIISLMALGLQPGDEVITTPFTFFATGGAITRLGARPLFCDIDPVTYNLSPVLLGSLLDEEIGQKKNDKIKGIIPVHLYGQCSDMAPVMTLAKKYGLFVLEDAAQAVGSEYLLDDIVKRTCAMGKAGILSFYPAKNLGAFGDAGMVLTNDEELGHKLKLLRVHGSSDKYFYREVGGNFRMDAIQGAVLRVKLKHLDEWHQKRQEKAVCYDRLFEESGLTDQGIVHTPEPVYKKQGIKHYHTFHQYVIRVKSRDELQNYLRQQGVPSAVFYPLPLHLQQCFAYLGYKEGDFPVSEKAASEVLALPIYPELTSEQQEVVVKTINDFHAS